MKLASHCYYVNGLETTDGKLVFTNTSIPAQYFYTDKVNEATLYPTISQAKQFMKDWEQIYVVEISATVLRQVGKLKGRMHPNCIQASVVRS